MGKTGSQLGDGFQKHLQELERMSKMMIQSQSLAISTFQIVPAKTSNLQAFFFDSYQNLEQKFILQNQQT